MAEARKAHKESRRYDVLRAVRCNPRASLRELMEMTGLSSTSVVAYHLDQLEKEGLLKRDHRKARAIYLSDDQPKRIEKPGPKAQAVPLYSPENYEKKAAAGRKTRANSGGAFTGKKSKEKATAEQKRIDEVVRKAKARRGSTVDVVHSDHVIRLDGLRASRLG